LQFKRTLVTTVILLAIVSGLFWTPAAESQSLTTTMETFTQVVVSTASTIELTSTQTAALPWGDSSWYTASFTIVGTGDQYCGIYGNIGFSASMSQKVFGKMSSDLPISFYLMTDKAYQSWIASKRCPVNDVLIRNEDSESYNLDWTAQQDGSYDFLFLNKNVGQVRVTFAPQITYPVTQDFTIYSISSVTTVYSHTYTISLSSFNQVSLILSLIALVSAFIVVEVWRTTYRTRNSLKRPLRSHQIACPKCGWKNHMSNSFCGRCANPLTDATHFYDDE